MHVQARHHAIEHAGFSCSTGTCASDCAYCLQLVQTGQSLLEFWGKGALVCPPAENLLMQAWYTYPYTWWLNPNDNSPATPVSPDFESQISMVVITKSALGQPP